MNGLSAVMPNTVMTSTLKASMPPIVPLSEISASREPTTLPTFMPMPNSASTMETVETGIIATSVVVLAI
ncbi:hypothetical protein D3C86_1957820 [compost metagenome]